MAASRTWQTRESSSEELRGNVVGSREYGVTEMRERHVPLSRDLKAEDVVDVLGVSFDRVTRSAALSIMQGCFGSKRAFKVFISNAHTVNLSYADDRYRDVLNGADLLLNDGVGVQIASYLAGKPFVDNLVGTDLTPQICDAAAGAGISVFLLGGESAIVERAAEGLKSKVSGIHIAGVHHGYFSEKEDPVVVDEINRSGAGILLVGFGNPIQEIWIHRNAHRLRCDLCIGVGGLFHHLSGRLRRAPGWVRSVGMEWAFILVNQPHKWRRYLLGNPLFLFRIVIDRLLRRRHE